MNNENLHKRVWEITGPDAISKDLRDFSLLDIVFFKFCNHQLSLNIERRLYYKLHQEKFVIKLW